jgi:hypothetical protein
VNRLTPWEYDRELYKRRNEVERLFRRLKGFRRIFSRSEKLDEMFTAFIHFALVVDGLLYINLKTEMAEGESAAVTGPTRLPASRVASPIRCNRCEPGSLVEPSTTPSSSLSIPVSRFNTP